MKRERGISRQDVRSLKAGLEDKVLACVTGGMRDAFYRVEPDYFDACAKWWDELTPTERNTAQIVIDTHKEPYHRRDVIEEIARALPPAPAYPRSLRV
jgi:hypothetical protein